MKRKAENAALIFSGFLFSQSLNIVLFPPQMQVNENILAVSSLWTQAMKSAAEDFSRKGENASCFVPVNSQRFQSKLANFNFPIINVGFPKCGTTTLHSYFLCCGYNSSHWYSESINDYIGICLRDAVQVGLPPISTYMLKWQN